MNERNRGTISFVVLVLISVVLSGAALVIASREVAASQHRWCAALVTLDTADRHAPPPATRAGRNLFADFHSLRMEFGCGGKP